MGWEYVHICIDDASRIAVTGTPDPQGAHHPFHRAAGDILAIAPQNVPNLARTAELAVVCPGRVDPEAQCSIGLGAARCPLRVTRDGTPVVPGGSGKRQRLADRRPSGNSIPRIEFRTLGPRTPLGFSQ